MVCNVLSIVVRKKDKRRRTKKSPSTCQLVSFLGSSGSLLPSSSGVPRLTMKLSPQLLLSLSIRSSPPNRSLIAAHALIVIVVTMRACNFHASYLRSKRFNLFSTLPRHMYLLRMPSTFVIRIKTKPHPHISHPFLGFFSCKSILYNDVSIYSQRSQACDLTDE